MSPPVSSLRSWLGALVLGCCTLGALPAWALCPAPVGASLRIKTWNLNLQVAPNNTESNYGRPHVERARDIARQILAEDPDVVVLSEANEDAARDVLVKELSTRYPNYIYTLDEHDTDNDSGLMLFSKYGFAALDRTLNDEGFQETWHDGYYDENIASWDIYSSDNTNGADAWSNKGFALVRILNECDGRLPFNVGFTHMQSSLPDTEAWRFYEDFDDRRGQLQTIRSIVEASISQLSRNVQPIYILGDLNIDGSRHHESTVRPPFIPVCGQDFMGNLYCDGDPDLDAVSWKPFTEWQYTFHDTKSDHGGYWACQNAPCTYDPATNAGTFFVDSWAYETSPLDVGQTHSSSNNGGATEFTGPTDGERLDYILHNKPLNHEREYCTQHLTRAVQGREWSDHLSVTIDVNRAAPRCSPHPRKVDDVNNPTPGITHPNGPEPVVFNLADPSSPQAKTVTFADGRLTFPGSMQWYVLDQAEPFRVTMTGSRVSWMVYQGSDLSRPLTPFDGECEEVKETRSFQCTYPAPRPPYFVRVFAVDTRASDPNAKPDRTVGDMPYTVQFHRFDCSSPAEACPLEPAVALTRQWPDRRLNANETMYFKFVTAHDRLDNPPRVTFHVQTSLPPKSTDPVVFSPSPFGAELADRSDNQLPTGITSVEPWTAIPGGHVQVHTARSGALPGTANKLPEKYLLRVLRDMAYVSQPVDLKVWFETSLSYFHPLQLACEVEETDLGGDDIWTRFVFDGPNQLSKCRESSGPAYLDCFWVSRLYDGDGSADATNEMYDGSLLSEAGTGDPNRALPHALTGAFQKSVVPNLWQDGEGIGGEQYLQPRPDVLRIKALPASLADRDAAAAKYTWRADDDEYWYDMVYRLSHSRPACHVGPDDGCPSGTACKAGKCQ
ncbi:endonuclease/exonuclease/phosphatase family protein [Pyxidicoccus trucidator]|uniref:endonuclease/exonuclease/phosphatase family protein n=1 Tax=Pyxidicoccus trucidator TaxID=2709662 RepID=UPI0013DBFFFC|nr:endonuclease/exonuclease/phosphatase family protein [Pyxidicoccus trucidator]